MDYDDCCSSSSSSSNDHVLPASHSPTPPSKRKAGRKKFRETRHPVYRGVRERNGGKWVCEVREPNKKTRIWLGTYPIPEMAARAYDVAAIVLRGKSAVLNFDDSAWLLPRAKEGSTAEEIRRVASEAAEMFRPVGSSITRRRSSSPLQSTVVEEVVLSLPVQPPPPPPAVFVDEEALFNMPGLMKEMAEGLMLPPPAMHGGGSDWDAWECNTHMDTSLWSN